MEAIVERVRAEVESAHGVTVDFEFGTMIEVVQTCMRASRLAEVAEQSGAVDLASVSNM